MRGFTLIELMVTVAIAAIMLSLAAPSFRTMVLNNRLSGQSDALFNGMNYARNAALSSRTSITFCPIGTAAAPATCGTLWAAGWMVLNATTGTVLQKYTAPTTGAVLATVAVGGGSAATTVSFDQYGLTATPAYFQVCDSQGSAAARSLYVLATGFVQTSPKPGYAAWDQSTALSCS